MKSCFLSFSELFGFGVVVQLYRFISLFTATISLKHPRLQLNEDFDIIVKLKGFVPVNFRTFVNGLSGWS